jgi:hypothetical protein
VAAEQPILRLLFARVGGSGIAVTCLELESSGSTEYGADVAPELEGPALKPPNPLNAGRAGLSPSFFSANAALPNVGAPNPVNLGAPVAPPAKPLKPPVEGFVAPDEPAALFKPAPNVEPEPSAPKPLALGCSVAAEVVAALDAFAEPPKNPPFRFGGVAAVGVSVEVDVEVAVLTEGPKNPPFLLFGGSASVVQVQVQVQQPQPRRFDREPPSKQGGRSSSP